MRVISTAIAAAFLLAAPTLAHAQAGTSSSSSRITCSQIPEAQRFVEGLKPGPNTRAAQQHLEAAKHASDSGNDRECVSELTRVNDYATRSADADKRGSAHHSTRHHVQCADAMHQDRPGGSDYKGPAVAGCPKRAL